MNEHFGEVPEPNESEPGLQELAALPHPDLVLYAFKKQEETNRLRSLLGSLARLQQSREIDHESQMIELEMSIDRDPLTGLLNKRAWINRLESYIHDEEMDFGVIFIDLSRFKLINDTFDHVRGDEVLQKTAEVIESSLRQDEDFVASDTGRYGGDEFAILCDLEPREDTEQSPKERLETVSRRLQENFHKMVAEEKLIELHIDAAIGCAVYEPGMTAEDLLRVADKAMYSDKYARTVDLTKDETIRLRSVKPILDKAGVRLPDGILDKD